MAAPCSSCHHLQLTNTSQHSSYAGSERNACSECVFPSVPRPRLVVLARGNAHLSEGEPEAPLGGAQLSTRWLLLRPILCSWTRISGRISVSGAVDMARFETGFGVLSVAGT